MEICNCMNCKKLIKVFGNIELCNACDQLLFTKIKEYLMENQGAKIEEISEATGISDKIIKAYVKSGRLEECRANSKLCSLCGDIINSDQVYCPQCLKRIKFIKGIRNLADEGEKKPNSNSSGMHFINTDKDSVMRRR